jgi:predicted AAA+ superfamily ATPase
MNLHNLFRRRQHTHAAPPPAPPAPVGNPKMDEGYVYNFFRDTPDEELRFAISIMQRIMNERAILAEAAAQQAEAAANAPVTPQLMGSQMTPLEMLGMSV